MALSSFNLSTFVPVSLPRIKLKDSISTHVCPRCAVNRPVASALAAAALSLGLIIPQPVKAFYYEPPATTLVVNTTAPSTPQMAVIGVAKAPIHDYGNIHYAEAENDEAQRELMLAARLITAVLLGVMVGIERRATRINLGVRSITLLTLCSAMVSLVATSTPGVALLEPSLAVSVMGGGAAAGLGVGVKARRRRTREAVAMCGVVGFVVAMGGACGAGVSLMAGACYLAAIWVMRASERRKLVAVRRHTRGEVVEVVGREVD